MKITPGPWEAMKVPPASKVDHGWRKICALGNDLMVAAPKTSTAISWDHEINAIAIAALPDCLEALKDELAALECWQTTQQHPSDLQEGFNISVDKIRSALKKAGCV